MKHCVSGSLLLLLVTGCAALMPVSQPIRRAEPPARPVASETSDDAAARRVAELVNRHRVAIGLRPLAWNPQVSRVARAHSVDMVRRGFFSHENPDRQSPFDRMRAAGLRYRAAGENIAAGQITADEVFKGWMRSKGHRENIDNPLYTEQGIAVYRRHWTQVFLTPR